MVQINLYSRISGDQVRPEKVTLDSRSEENPVRVPDDYVLFDDVSCIDRSWKTDAEVRPLRRKTIST